MVFLYFRRSFAVNNGQKLEIFDIFWYLVNQAFFSGTQFCDELRQFVNVLVSKVFHVTEKYIFEGSF